MTIKGIGRVSKKEAMEILTREGREAVMDGEISVDDLAKMYKMEMVRRLSNIGKMEGAFDASYNRVPEQIKDLAPEQIAAVVDALYQAYSDGKNEDR